MTRPLWVRIVNAASELLTLKDWYLGNPYHVEEFRFVDSPGTVLTDVQAAGLVSAMAAFGAGAQALGVPSDDRTRQGAGGAGHYGLAVSAVAML